VASPKPLITIIEVEIYLYKLKKLKKKLKKKIKKRYRKVIWQFH